MTYTELINAVQAILETTFPPTDTAAGGTGAYSSADQLAMFVRNAEQRIFNTVQFPSLRRNVTGQLDGGSAYLNLPDDFLAPYSLAVIGPTGAYTYLLNKDVNFIREAYPNPASDQGLPKFYALFGPTTEGVPPTLTTELSALLGPTPDADYDVELHYFFYPESIVTAGTTWLGDNLESVLLAATVLEAAIFQKAEEAMLKTYAMRYEEALKMAKRMGDGMQRGDGYRNGQARMPVN